MIVDILQGLLMGAGIIVGSIAVAHLLGLWPPKPRKTELEALVEKYGPEIIAEARQKFDEMPSSMARAVWFMERFGRNYYKVEQALMEEDHLR